MKQVSTDLLDWPILNRIPPEDFRIRFAVQTFIDGIGDCELQQVLRMARHRNSSEALVHAPEFEAAKSASHYINGLVPSYCACITMPLRWVQKNNVVGKTIQKFKRVATI